MPKRKPIDDVVEELLSWHNRYPTGDMSLERLQKGLFIAVYRKEKGDSKSTSAPMRVREMKDFINNM